MSTLHLTLKKQWFDMTAYGAKQEEYREVKPYWQKRLQNADGTFKTFDTVTSRNGYAAEAPTLVVECKGIKLSTGTPEWGAEPGVIYYVIELGEIKKLKI
jgi:hypothetical protein